MAGNNVLTRCVICEQPFEIGDEVVVTGAATVHKDLPGTDMYGNAKIPAGKMRARLTHRGLRASHRECFEKYHDYETYIFL